MTEVSAPRILIYVQHLLGIGHYKRAAVIARAAAAKGLEVTLMSGGRARPGVDLGTANLMQLPPVHAKEDDFTTLLTEDGSVVDDSWRARRAAVVLEEFQRIRPDVLVIELFPFGRRQMRFELLPLLRAAREADHCPIVVSSIRDILVGQDRPGRADKVCHHLETLFDHVLVHGDPNLVTLNETFPQVGRIEKMLTYTGYVADQTADVHSEHTAQEVLVSAGGGATGQRVHEVALACRPLTNLRDRTWRILVGARGNIQSISSQAGKTGADVIVEPVRLDFPALLKSCALSISQAGYNTIVETLQANAPSVIVPFATGKESEQTLRAKLLAERGLIKVVPEAGLSPETLAEAVNSVFRTSRGDSTINLSGAEVTADLLDKWARSPARSQP